MSVTLDLLPPQVKYHRRQQRQRRYIMVAGVAVLALLLGSSAYLYLAASRVESKIAAVEQERLVMEQLLPRYRPYQQLNAAVNRKTACLEAAVGRPVDWSRLLQEMGASLPADVWLTDWQGSYPPPSGAKSEAASEQAAPSSPGAAGQITVRGWAFDHPAVADWLAASKRLPEWDDVRLNFASRQYLYDQPLIQFELQARLRPQAAGPQPGLAAARRTPGREQP